MKKTKKTRRDEKKYPALSKTVNLKTRQDLIDYDYIDKLSDKEKKFLNQFTEEYTNASFKKGKRLLNKKIQSEKDCYDRNNARNRCILTRAKAAGKAINDLDAMAKQTKKMNWNVEDKLIEMLDSAANSSDSEEDYS